ncbi:MAG: hybrid sensor histidine kinase/response regulator, partial [Spirochaetota bacterium]
MKPKILVVDDMSENIGLLFDILRDEYAVVAATTAEEALTAAFTLPHPNLILLDIMMPRTDGYQLAEMLKNDDRTRHIPIIFVTALNGVFDEERAFTAGAVDFISKPLIPSILRARIHTQIELERRSRQLEAQCEETNILFEHQPAGLAYVARDNETHSFVRVNSELCRMFGFSKTECRTLPPELLFSAQEDWDAFSRECESRGITENFVFSSIPMKKSNGSTIYCRIHGRLLSRTEEHSESVWTVFNMTHEYTLEQLRRKVEKISRHDLKAPLNGIINLPAIIRSENNLSSMQNRMLDLIEKSGKLMLSHINESLNLLRIEEGTYEYAPQQFNLTNLLVETVSLYDNMYEARNLKVVLLNNGAVMNENDLVPIRADRDLYGSVLSNLLINAIEASKDGDMITIRTETSPGTLTLSVHNSGTIPKQVRDTFFSRFSTYGKSS